MKVILLTQDDPFYLPSKINKLLAEFPAHSQVVGCVLFDISPFGKRETFVGKVIRTISTFGFNFFFRYSLIYLLKKITRSGSVKRILKEHNIPTIKLIGGINNFASIEKIKRFKPDLLISIAGNQIYKKPLIELAPKGCLNLHTALLPKYRGLMPSFWVLKNNEKETGVSVFFVDEGIDTGPIIVQKRIEIGDMTLEELIKHSKQIGMEAIIEAVNLIEHGNFSLIDNDDSQKSYYSFPKRQDVKEFLKIWKRFF